MKPRSSFADRSDDLEPDRWRDAVAATRLGGDVAGSDGPGTGAHDLGVAIGSAIRQTDQKMGDTGNLSDLRLAHIRQRVLAQRPRRHGIPAPRARTVAIAVVALLTGSMATALGERLLRSWRGESGDKPVPSLLPRSGPPDQRARHRHAWAAKPIVAPPAAAPQEEEASAAPLSPASPPLPVLGGRRARPGPVGAGAGIGTPATVPAPRPLPRSATSPPPQLVPQPPAARAPAPALQPAALEEEASLLADALRLLRHEGDARGALARLDRYDRRFARGTLRHEAELTRVEALIAVADRPSALALLDRIEESEINTRRRVALLRAELRAQRTDPAGAGDGRGRCAEAISDFDRVLASEGGDALADRALFGRALCVGRQRGEEPGRAALVDYLRRFPSGLHRAEAERRLRPSSPPSTR